MVLQIGSRGRSIPVLGRGLQVVAVKHVVDGLFADPEHPCRLEAVALSGIQCLDESDTFQFMEGNGGQRQGFGGIDPRVETLGDFFGTYGSGIAEDIDPFQNVLEFADVAGPRVSSERGPGVWGELNLPVWGLQVEIPEFAIREGVDELWGFAQGGHAYGDDGEPEVEVFAEGSIANGVLQVGVGGADDADVGQCRPVPAQPAVGLRLEEDEQLGLCCQWHLGNFIQEEGSTVGDFDQTRAAPGCSGESAFLVSEQFGLDEVRGQSRAIDCDKRGVVTRAFAVDELGEMGFACAAFTGQEDGDIESEDTFEFPAELVGQDGL